MISLKQLSYALAVGRTLHFKRAAEQCHVSQSALSTGLSELEKQLGFPVFERDNKKVFVTEEGKEVLERVAKIMVEVQDLQSLVDSRQSPLSLPIRVGMIPTIAPYLLPKLYQQLKNQYPNAQVQVSEQQSHVLVEQVKHGELDTAILALPYDCEGLLSLEFWEEDFYWIARKGNVKARQKEITSHEMSEHHLMLLNEGHCLKGHILEVCKLPKPESQNSFGASSLSTLIEMVLANIGTTLIPSMAREALLKHHPELQAIHLNEASPHRRIAFIFRPNYPRFGCVDALADVCKFALA